jgi:hypothetical protein
MPQVGLAHLVAAAGAAAAEFDAAFAHSGHDPLNEVIVRFAQDEVEGVVARTFQFEVRAVLAGVDPAEEMRQVFGPALTLASSRLSWLRPRMPPISVLRTL